ncbi:MAG: hypothetical protein HC925_03100 [Coleofasciculaceae cyanobacterium SM2_3_26]|nr:hypothetical protein [Coleofasciculaceae cyanobacterium SM2_3_26]
MRMAPEDRAALERWLLEAPAQLRERFEVVEAEGRVVTLKGAFGIIVAAKGKA